MVAQITISDVQSDPTHLPKALPSRAVLKPLGGAKSCVLPAVWYLVNQM